MRKGDDFNDNVILMSMLQNYGVNAEGKVVRLSKIKSGDQRSLLERAELTESGLKIDGLSSDGYITFRAMVQNRANAIKGSLPAEDRNLAGISTMSRMLFMFRNWIPGLAATRFKNLTFNKTTQEVDAGRFRVMFGDIVNTGFLPATKEFSKLLLEVANYGMFYKKAVNTEAAKKYYTQYIQQHNFSDNKKADNYLSFEDFMEMRRAKIRGVARELQIYMSLILLVMLAKAAIPDDKDSWERKAAIMAFRATQRSAMEVGFFINPTNTTGVLNNLVPQMTLLRTTRNWVENTFQETGYLITGEKRPKSDKRPALFYSAKLIPGIGGFTDFWDTFGTFDPNSSWNR
jgi:hypothetical protein